MRIRKIGAAAAMLATAAVIGLSAPAEAKSNNQGGVVGSYNGSYCGNGQWRPGCKPRYHRHHHNNDWRFNLWFGPGPWYYYDDPMYYGPGYGYARPYYYNNYHVRSVMSCRDAKSLLWSKGYRNVSARDCQGRTYSFNATKNGQKYRITLNAYTGRYSRSMIY